MARKFLFATLAVLLFVAISHNGVRGGDDDDEDPCPDVADLVCSQTQPAPAGCRKTATITLEDGTECPGCDFCIEDGVVSVNREFGRMCPPIPCPAIAVPENCNSTFYEQKVELLNHECTLCQSAEFECPEPEAA